jgi:hypothetical protein
MRTAPQTRSLFAVAFVAVGLVLAVVPMGEAKGEIIKLDSRFTGLDANQAPDVFLFKYDEGLEGLDDYDIPFEDITGPRVSFFSDAGFDLLAFDVRPLDSITTYHTVMEARDLTGPVEGDLRFTLDVEAVNSTNTYFADIYKAGAPVLLGVNVKNYFRDTTLIPLSLADGESYTIDIRTVPVPEPSTFLLMGLGAIGMCYVAQRRRKCNAS